MPRRSSTQLSEKQRIELATAELFLRLFNSANGTSFSVQGLGDAPDVICHDKTGREINLEITQLEDLPGETKHALGRGARPVSRTTGTTVRSFTHDVIPQLARLLEKKLLSSFGPSTALVIRQVSPIWGPSEWQSAAREIREEVFRGREANYGAGVWIICTDASTWPASDTVYCLAPTDSGP